MKKIAILNTGDEVVTGDILNRNSQTIAEQLTDHGMFVGQHLSVRDDDDDMQHALSYLLQDHDAVITTGGLGPTSDDRTRYAISEVLNIPLNFDETSWEHIVNRVRKYTAQTIPESNKQQALFPQGAKVLHNAFGTANGCIISKGDKVVCMLPGPPRECMPLVTEHVTPHLLAAQFATPRLKQSWYLFRASEGLIAEKLDQQLQGTGCTTGYRVTFPYIEFKLFAESKDALQRGTTAIAALIQPHLIGAGEKIASDYLQEQLINSPTTLTIVDNATGGMLENMLRQPALSSKVKFFGSEDDGDWQLTISGLHEYWQQKNQCKETAVALQLIKNGKTEVETTLVVPFRADLTRQYAAEYICEFLLENLSR